jgi:NADH dehydrogenase
MRIDRVLVLGASGFVGRSVCAQLAQRGLAVRAMTRDRLKARNLAVLPAIEIVHASPHDEESLLRAMDGVDAVVNLVGILHQSRRQSFDRVHVELPQRVARACQAAAVRRLVHVSALHARSDGPSAYLRSRGRGEEVLRAEGAGLAITVLKPSVIFGRDDSFLNLFAGLVRPLPIVPLAGAEVRFQPVWVEDVARAVGACLGDERTVGQSYDLCGPRVYRLREIVRWAAELQGLRRTIVALPAWAAELQALVLEHLPGPVMTRDNLRSMEMDSVCDCAFPSVFGFAPSAMEAIVPEYMTGGGSRGRYSAYRQGDR